MDKFGIFKLLNSFFDFYKQNSTESSTSSSTSQSPLSNATSNLFSSLNGNSLGSSPTNSSAPQGEKIDKNPGNNLSEKSSPSISTHGAPLQEKMLSTMRSHDDFVKRVSEKNKIQP